MDRELIDRALRAYARALNVVDPIRLQFWDGRGLTMPQLRVMFLLLDHDGQSAGELAQAMRVRPATITGLTDRLSRQKLIERQADAADRRIVRVVLTSEGRGVVRAVQEASRAYLEMVFADLGEEKVRSLTESLREFARAAEDLQDRAEFRP